MDRVSLLVCTVVGCIGGQASAGLVGYRFSGAVDNVSNVAGTTWESTQIGDSVVFEFLFDATSLPSLIDLDLALFAWEYSIPSFALQIGGVSPSGPPREIVETTLWGMTDDRRQGNDSLLTVGVFESGEFLTTDMVFDSSDVFEPALDPSMTLPPLNLSDATIVSSSGLLFLGAGSYVEYDITSITFIPTPGASVVVLAGLIGMGRRRSASL